MSTESLEEYALTRYFMDTPLPVAVLDVPPYYQNPDQHMMSVLGLENDSSITYARALHWRLSGHEESHALAKKFILAWVGTFREAANQEAKLVLAYKGQRFLFAAMWCSWTPKERIVLSNWVNGVFRPVCESLTLHWNNWGAWGYAGLALCERVTGVAVSPETASRCLAHIRRATRWFPIFGGSGHLWMENMRTTYGLKYAWFALEGYLVAAALAGDVPLWSAVDNLLATYWPYVQDPEAYRWRSLKWMVPGFVFPSGEEFLTPSPESWPVQVYRVAGAMCGEDSWATYGDADSHDGFNAFRWPYLTARALLNR